jgi:hypothetical protein
MRDKFADPPSSNAELAELEFAAIELRPVAEFWTQIGALRGEVSAAIDIAGKSKTELVAELAERHDELGPLLMRFAKAAELARSVAEVCRSYGRSRTSLA